jgi:hypothetical protein
MVTAVIFGSEREFVALDGRRIRISRRKGAGPETHPFA